MRRLMVVGLNHKTAPLDLRERLAFSPKQREEALVALRNEYGECEAVLLSTCNRTEIYIARETHGHPREADIAGFLAKVRSVDAGELRPRLYYKTERDVVEHLFSVASSLDSMVLGETQILAQVREAYEAARDAGTAGPMLHPLFQRATAVGKQVRAQTPLSEGRVSVASVAVNMAKRIFDSFTDKTVLSIGAGKMGALVLGGIAALNPGRLLVCNRDVEKAQSLVERFNGAAAPMEKLADHLAAADIVLTSTGSTEPIITRELFEAVIRRRKYKPVFIIDIAVPRDVAADVGEIENVYLYNLDDLQQAVAATMDRRSAAARDSERIIEENVLEFVAWHRARMMGPLIDQLYQRSHAVAQEELSRTIAKLSGATDDDRRNLEELTRRIVNKLLHDPIQVLRGVSTEHAPMTQYLHAVEKLFNLEEKEIADVEGGAPGDSAGKEGGPTE